MSSQLSNFRRTDVRRAVQAMQTAGLKVGHVELREAQSALSPPNDEDDGGDDSNNGQKATGCCVARPANLAGSAKVVNKTPVKAD
jgi:hypothetical protein